MANRLKITEVVWRGPMVLVCLPNQEMLRKFLKSYIKIYWGNECKAQGEVHTFIEKEDEKELNMLLDIVGVNDPQNLTPPTELKVLLDGQEFSFAINLFRKGEEISFFKIGKGTPFFAKTKRATI